MAFRRPKREEIRPELTPMVDVVFLLLIFFMISTTFVETPGLTVKLPESSAQQIEREPEEVKVYLSKEGEIFLREEKLTEEKLRRRLAKYGDQAERMTFLLLADKDARHGEVVRIMDLAREEGFRKLAIATEMRRKK